MFGTGGDEINENCYQKDPSTQEDLKRSGATLEKALDSFTRSTHGALRQLGKKVVVWEFASRELSVGNWKHIAWSKATDGGNDSAK